MTLDRERQAIQLCRKEVKKIFAGALKRWRSDAQEALKGIAKASGAVLPTPMHAYVLTAEERDQLLLALGEMAKNGASAALQSLAVTDISVDVVNNLSRMAEAWAENYGGAMMQGIANTTRNDVARIVAKGIELGEANEDIAKSLKSAYAFSDQRAEMIARTETAYADVAGNVATYAQVGVEKKRWVVGSESCEMCLENEAQGAIPFNASFLDGSFAPPAHPNCTCDIIPVLD